VLVAGDTQHVQCTTQAHKPAKANQWLFKNVPLPMKVWVKV